MILRLVSLVCLVSLSGCGPRLADVHGTVTFKGERLSSGTVCFVVGDKVYERDIHEGAYQLTGISPGLAQVTVVRLDPSQPDPYVKLGQVRRHMIEKQSSDPKALDPDVVTDPLKLRALQKKQHLLPLAYATPATSDLRATIKPGANTFDIALQEK